MPPELVTPDGKQVDLAETVNRQFEAAMNDDGPDEQAPPKRQPKAPAEADAPKRPRGRPKSEQPRATAKTVTALDDGARAAGVRGLVQIGAGIALMLGKATKREAFEADAIVLASAADEIADACVQTAHIDAAFAARLDKVCSAGPYAALITVAVSVGSQFARNHRPALTIPGTVDPAEILKAAEANPVTVSVA